MALWDAETLDELLARDFSKLSPAVRTRTERLARATANGEAVTERWTFYPKGQPVTVQAIISTYVQADGRSVLLFEATPIDVEDGERRAVEALRHTSSLITLFTYDGSPIFANPAAIATYGDRVGFCERFSDEQYGMAVFDAVLAGSVLAELVEVSSLVGTRSHHIDARQVLDPVTGEVSVLLSERDVTAQVEAERALLIAEERAAVAVAKEQFLSNVSHELRTPLTAILGYSALIKSQTNLPQETLARIEKISTAGESLLGMVTNIITLAELDRGDIPVHAEHFRLRELLQRIFDEYKNSAAQTGIRLRLELPDLRDDYVIGDQNKILTIMRIFASNALKFTGEGEVTIGTRNLRQTQTETHLTFYIRDTGTGFDQNVHRHIFDRFSQSNAGRERTGGAGLGLAVAAGLTRALSGHIGAEANIGEGATFYFSLRLSRGNGGRSSLLLGSQQKRDHAAVSILYADDNENNRSLVAAILGSQGYNCDLVENGQLACEAVEGRLYDLILMDIQMPIMDGVTATKRIRQMPSLVNVPILALTANYQAVELKQYHDAGMNDCVFKPIQIPDLIGKIAEWTNLSS